MSDSTLQARPHLAARLASAVRRRLRYAGSRLPRRQRRAPVEAAFDWLLASEADGGLLDQRMPCFGSCTLTGACIETAVAYGCRAEAARWARWLVSVQRADGSFPEAVMLDDQRAAKLRASGMSLAEALDLYLSPTFSSTAWTLRGFLALVDDLPEFEEPARRACRHLHAWFDDQGLLQPPHERCRLVGFGLNWQILSLLPVLRKAGQRWGDRPCSLAADRALQDFIHTGREPGRLGPGFPIASTDHAVDQVEALLDAGDRHRASRLSERIIRCQRRDGSVRHRLAKTPRLFPPFTLSSTIARAAVLWYRLGDRERADRAMRYLERRQRRDGSLPVGTRRWFPASRRRSPWAVKYYLDAALLRVRAAFDARWQEFPDRIDPADGRTRAVRLWFEALPPNAHVADVGCGKGRFLRHLAERFPQARLTGIDVSSAMLAQLPPAVEAREGSILRIPAADGEFHGAFAVESLEHSLVPHRAIAELCRIVRPGGRVLVIDKHRAQQPLSEHDPWERWFLPEELAGWLSRHCENVTVAPVSHLEGRGSRDLFLAAAGTRTMGPCADDSR